MLLALVAVMAAVMAVYCVVRYTNFFAGLDLSLFDQAIWHYSHFSAPMSTIKGFDLLGDHFHPTVALLAPLYWLWSDPRMLLIGASVLVAASAIPVFLFARARLPRSAAYLLTVAYLVFWGLQIGVGYEFHEVELGPPLIALAILLADRRRWGWFYLVILLTLGVKEDMGIFVAFFGVYLLSVRQWRRGVALLVVGIAWYELATRVAIPHFAPPHQGYTYWTYTELGRNLPGALLAVLKAPWRLVTISLSPGVKAGTLLYLFAPFLFLSVFSRWFILALPLLAERFLSTRAPLWGTSLDYSLTIAPVLAISAAQGLANVQRWLGPWLAKRRRRAPLRLGVAICAAMAIVSVGLTFSLAYSPFRLLLNSSFYQAPWIKGGAERAIAHVPSGAPVNANDALLTHLSHRDYASEIMPGRLLKGYVIADLGEPVGAPSGNPDFSHLGSVLTEYLRQATPIYYTNGWLVAKRAPVGQAPTNGIMTPLPRSTAHNLMNASAQWQTEFGVVGGRLFSCYAHLARGQSCSVPSSAALAQREHTLNRLLSLAQQQTPSPCRTLAADVQRNIATVNQEALIDARLGSPSMRATSAHLLGALLLNIGYRDVLGRLNRFLVLCSPRTPTG